MPRAPLPTSVKLLPFFVLRWDADMEEMVLHLADASRTSYSMGSDLPQAARQLTLWGVKKIDAERAIDAAREFRAVQVILDQDRIIPLIPRAVPNNAVAQQFAEIEQQESTTYVHL